MPFSIMLPLLIDALNNSPSFSPLGLPPTAYEPNRRSLLYKANSVRTSWNIRSRRRERTPSPKIPLTAENVPSTAHRRP